MLLCFALGLLSKPMVVTLPFVLFLLDYWPLGRLSLWRDSRGLCGGTAPSPFHRLLLEKAPFLALSAASCAVTILAQAKGRAMSRFSMWIQASNAVLSYVADLRDTVWPTRNDTEGKALPAVIVSIQTAGDHSLVFAAAILRGLFQANVLSLAPQGADDLAGTG